jgi:hypothetical protein
VDKEVGKSARRPWKESPRGLLKQNILVGKSGALAETGYAVVLTKDGEEEDWFILAGTIPEAFEALWKLRTRYLDRSDQTFGFVVYKLDGHQEIARV